MYEIMKTVAEATRTCAKCDTEKPIEEFRMVQHWRLRYCKQCERKQMMEHHHRTWDEYYPKHQEVRKQRTREYYHGVAKPRNLEQFGKCATPEQAARTIRVRAENKVATGYAKTEKEREQSRAHFLELRTKALSLYGGKCECCGESRYDMLTFDHKPDVIHETKIRGVALVYEVIREFERSGYPNSKYRILCWNCNLSYGLYGYCPHDQTGTGSILVEKPSYTRRLKLAVIKGYGGKCVICEEQHWEFLTIDHKNGGGSQHRKEIGGVQILYRTLRDQGYPEGEYRLLCACCNCSQKHNKYT